MRILGRREGEDGREGGRRGEDGEEKKSELKNINMCIQVPTSIE
jgi:hypothetical protein